MDSHKLLKAIEDDTNDNLLNFTTDKILEMNLTILKELQLPKNKTLEILNKLQNYRYIDAMNELNYGSYIRWINISNIEKLSLAKGGIFCDLSITDNGVYIVCKGFTYTHFKIKMDECLIFQKLKPQEQILLTALDHLNIDH